MQFLIEMRKPSFIHGGKVCAVDSNRPLRWPMVQQTRIGILRQVRFQHGSG